MSVLLQEIRRLNAAAADELKRAGICTNSDIQSLTREDLSELFPGVENFRLRKTIFEIIHKKKPINVLLEDLQGFIPLDSLRAALSSNGILVDYLLILKDMKIQLHNVQTFLEAHINLLEKIGKAQPNQEPHTGSQSGWSQSQQSSDRRQEQDTVSTGAPFDNSAACGPTSPHNNPTCSTIKPYNSWYRTILPFFNTSLRESSKVAGEQVISPTSPSGDRTHGHPQKTKATVKYKMVVTGKTFDAHVQLLNKIGLGDPDLNMVQVEEGQSSEDFQIIIVFCPIVSRAGTDVEAAMRTVTEDKPVILVLMNHSREAKSTPSVRGWSGSNNVVLDVNIFYHETLKGLIQCSQNEDAVYRIRQELLVRSTVIRTQMFMGHQ